MKWRPMLFQQRRCVCICFYSLFNVPVPVVFEREGIGGRLLIIPEVSMIVSYWVDHPAIRVMRVLHQKQKFPVK